jgi:hypothetical protein
MGGFDLVLRPRAVCRSVSVEVIAITPVAANIAAIVGGILDFGETIGSGATGAYD